MIAKLLHGAPLMVDHTPEEAISAGEVVLVGGEPRIAHNDIPAGRLGALAAGGGVYDVAKDNSDISDGDTLYYDEAEENVTTDASGNEIWGRAAGDAGTSATRCRAIHDPSAGS